MHVQLAPQRKMPWLRKHRFLSIHFETVTKGLGSFLCARVAGNTSSPLIEMGVGDVTRLQGQDDEA
jgi:hypothetical protein